MKSDLSIEAMSKAMSLRLKRHAAIAGNIANADTPGYRPKQIAFEDSLQRAVLGRSVGNLEKVEGRIFTIDDGTPRPDGNSVNMDKQMANMTENTLLYSATAEFVARKLRMIKSVM